MTPTTAPLDSAHVVVAGDTAAIDDYADALAAAGADVRRPDTVAAALETVRSEPIDCLVTEITLTDATAVEILEGVRNESSTLPVIAATADGDEAVASELIGAGVTDYLALPGPDAGSDARDGRLKESIERSVEELVDRTERAIERVQRAETRRERARRFDAVLEDTRTATWVLDADGTLERANRTARDLIDDDVDVLVGDPFWTLPWWSAAEGTMADVRRLVEMAQSGSFGNAVVSRSASLADPDVIDLSVRPVRDDGGTVTSIVVEGVDITDRVSLERDLRRSEELHRVTLNNMTDTVLITNEAGEYTYVCPNVHFIFGYTAAEIEDLGTIDDLLGADLFDREELAENGVLKNIECTATDKAGREHTLLVNVREVAIQDGTLLYSCRDVTKRKQREEALATLQETARDFLYAETHEEIASHVVDDTPGVLDLDASAVYLFDDDATELRPAARSRRMRDRHGPLPAVGADDTTLVGHSFVADDALFLDDAHGDDRLGNRASDLRSMAAIPLGSHGVFLIGSTTVGAFDAVTRELADLLAATAEAALDRVSRESRLRKQERTLQRRNEELTELNRVNETIRAIDRAVVRAETGEEIDHSVCEHLTDDDRFRFAWIGTIDERSGTVEPRAWAGEAHGYLDARPFTIDADGGDPAGRAAATGETTVVENVAERVREESWRRDALSREYRSAVSIPLVYNDLSHGILTVYTTTRNAVDDTTRAVLGELGETIAAGLSANERKKALLTTSLTRVEFAVDDPTFVLSRLARRADCTIAYHGGVRQTDEGRYVFVTVQDAPLDAVADAAADLVAIDDVRRINGGRSNGAGTSGDADGAAGTGGVLRLRLTSPFLALDLADHGAVVREATADPDSATLVVAVPDGIGLRRVTELVRETFSDVELRSKRTLDRSPDHDRSARVLADVTDRQLEVVQTAYYSGFFESPREHTGEEVADTLDISPPAFYRHVRTVQRKVFTALFEEGTVPLAARE
ncbi:bacterio-opsin activator domain-containing protein [Halopenitus sp. POP-27]|uniref:bacterio-opsin activator domain-containing protein n=1 Tax=Halopenitus sp. POP-27 TaxID=2994425 RepID=UPI0024684FB2|nr:bacterio-opsin activator domain-containing protein [Halopenitus sp. POP-27]